VKSNDHSVINLGLLYIFAYKPRIFRQIFILKVEASACTWVRLTHVYDCIYGFLRNSVFVCWFVQITACAVRSHLTRHVQPTAQITTFFLFSPSLHLTWTEWLSLQPETHVMIWSH